MTTAGKNFAKTLIPVVGIVLFVSGGLFLVKNIMHQQGAVGIEKVSENATSDNPGMAEGAVLPNFKVRKFGDNSSATPISTLGGKVTLVNFWATWCEACMVEMPSIIRLQDAYKDKGLQVVAVDLDEQPESVLPKTLQRLGIRFPVYLDTGTELADLFDIHAIPLTVVLDKNRKVLLIENGERDWNGKDFRAALERWLSG
jgi:thiol-disulfide isomerase/thioredoxin